MYWPTRIRFKSDRFITITVFTFVIPIFKSSIIITIWISIYSFVIVSITRNFNSFTIIVSISRNSSSFTTIIIDISRYSIISQVIHERSDRVSWAPSLSSQYTAFDLIAFYFIFLLTVCTASAKSCNTKAAAENLSKSCHDSPAQPRLSIYPINRQNRSFQSKWYMDYSLLEYSVQNDACYCYICRHFLKNKSNLGDAFCTTGFNNWKNALGKAGGLTKHALTQCHLISTKNHQSFKYRSETNE